MGTKAWRPAHKASFPVLFLLLVTSCHRGPGPEGSPRPASEPPAAPQCRPVTARPPTSWPEAPKQRPEKSHVRLEIKLPRQRLAQELERRIPVRLARGKDHPIGAAGRVSFDVRRGQFSLHDRKRTLAVRVPIHIDMSVCKPFAGTCVTYGRCIPRYEVTASIDKELRDGELPPLHLEQRLLQGCQIGIDVTPMITAVVEEQLVRAQSDAQGQIPRLSPLLRMATRSVDLPLEVAPELCLDVAPKKLSWLAPSLDANWLSTGASLDVALVPVDCQAELPVPKVPPLENSTKKKKPRVRLPERVSTAAIERGLAEVLAQSKGDELSVRVQSITPGKDGLLLELELQGSYCGTILLPTRTTMTEGSLSLVPFDIEETGLEPSLHGQLHRRLSAPLPLALPGRDLAGSLPGLLSALLPLLEAQIGEKISLTLPEPDRSYAQPLADGVQITHVLEGPVTVESSL